jgi:hypothetical protein
MSPRDIEVKTLLNDAEFADLKNECKAAEEKHGPLLRKLAKAWIAEQKDKRQRDRNERPAYGPNQALLLPSRNFRPTLRMRL